jgi:hypothetical protein
MAVGTDPDRGPGMLFAAGVIWVFLPFLLRKWRVS